MKETFKAAHKVTGNIFSLKPELGYLSRQACSLFERTGCFEMGLFGKYFFPSAAAFLSLNDQEPESRSQ